MLSGRVSAGNVGAPARPWRDDWTQNAPAPSLQRFRRRVGLAERRMPGRMPRKPLASATPTDGADAKTPMDHAFSAHTHYPKAIQPPGGACAPSLRQGSARAPRCQPAPIPSVLDGRSGSITLAD